MKTALIVLMALTGLAAIQSPRESQAAYLTMETAASTYTVVGVDIGTATPTDLTNNQNGGYRQVCAQNLDTTYALYCSENIVVSSAPSSNNVGVIVPPASAATTPSMPTCFHILEGTKFYCRSGSTTGLTRAVIIRSR